MHNFKELKIWNRAIDLTKEIYAITKAFPKEELFGLTLQLRRAMVSVASNIAEGAGRNSEKEFVQYLSMSYGSLCEAITQIIIAVEITYLDKTLGEACLSRAEELQKMIYQLRKNILEKIEVNK